MDFKKIFIKGACPTKIGGQAVLEGIMMKGEDRTAVVVRLGNDRLHIKTEKLPTRSKAAEIPIVRGVYIFVTTLMTGMKTLIYSAEALESLAPDEPEAKTGDGSASSAKTGDGSASSVEAEEAEVKTGDGSASSAKTGDGSASSAKTGDGSASSVKTGDGSASSEEAGGTEKSGEKEGGLPFGVMIALSVAIAIAFVVGIFIIVPTIAVNFLGTFTDNAVVLNLFEGVLRIVLFVVYIAIVSRLKDIQTTFEYHGAEHKTIHCFESGLPLTPANAASFETLHPRCGTSFLMFVMIIALLLFSLLGWPNLAMRILSRIIFIPLIAGLSYELLRFAGSSDTTLVKVLSVPGLLLQKLTTRTPDAPKLEVAIAAMKAVLVPADEPDIEGFCDLDGRLLPTEDSLEFQSALEGQWA